MAQALDGKPAPRPTSGANGDTPRVPRYAASMAAKKSKAGGPESPAPDDPRGFEERLDALEAVVRDLEGEELSLEDSLGRYQQGVEHLKACRSMLDAAEARLAELVASAEGDGLEERPLRVTDQGLIDAEES